MTTHVYIGISQDGFIARQDGAIDWLTEPDATIPEGEDFGYHAFFDTVDVMVMGRNTFETVLGFGGEWPYGSKRVIILSRKGIDIPDHLRDRVSVTSDPVQDIYNQLLQDGAQNVYVDGGLTIQSFLRAGCIDQLTITRLPVLIGTGLPLFGELDADIHLQHISTQAYDCGFVQSVYSVLK